MNEQGTSQNQEKADSEPQTGEGGAESDAGRGDCRAPVAWDRARSLRPDFARKADQKGWAGIAPGLGSRAPGPPLACQQEGELSVDVFLCSF